MSETSSRPGLVALDRAAAGSKAPPAAALPSAVDLSLGSTSGSAGGGDSAAGRTIADRLQASGWQSDSWVNMLRDFAQSEGSDVAKPWWREVVGGWRRDRFHVTVRTFTCELGEVVHLALSSDAPSSLDWRTKQHLKDAIAGPDAAAIEIYPPADQLEDRAMIYHLMVVPWPLIAPLSIKGM